MPVTCVDSRQVGVATGYAALAAADVLDAGGSVDEAARAARERAASATSLFYVDTLEYLRRGGRIGAAAALLGGALAVKPLLSIEDGKVANLETGPHLERGRWPGSRSWPSRRQGSNPVDVCVAHLANRDRAEALAGAAHRAAGRQPRGPRDLVRRARRRPRRARRARHDRGLRGPAAR